jgi:hypothetical protein
MDGIMIHAGLVTDRSLAQGYNTTTNKCSPDWTDPTKQPTITLRLSKGATPVTPSQGKWYYNDVEIEFNTTTGKSTGDYANKFLKGTDTTTGAPTLKIIDNLAEPGNLNRDVISYRGTVEDSGVQLEFSADKEIRITEISANGFWGSLYTDGGEKEFSEEGQSITIRAELTNGGENITPISQESEFSNKATLSNKFYCVWTVNGDTDGGNHLAHNDVNEDDVVDYAVVMCEFHYCNNGTDNVVFMEKLELDDTVDPEFLWVSATVKNSSGPITEENNIGPGATTDLRRGQSVDFGMKVGTITDPTPNTAWDKYECKPFDQAGNVVDKSKIAALSSLTPAADGFYDISKMSGGKRAGEGSLTVTYDDLTTVNSGVNFVLRISKSNS